MSVNSLNEAKRNCLFRFYLIINIIFYQVFFKFYVIGLKKFGKRGIMGIVKKLKRG